MFKQLYKLGFLAYVALIILSIIFFKERTIFTDIAFHLFDIITKGTVTIQTHRFGAVFTQLFPLVASKLNLPLVGVMMTYSTGFIIYYTICYVICGFVFKNYKLGLALLLFNILFVSDTFFWMQSELPQGVAFTICLFAFMSSKRVNDLGAFGLAFSFFSIMTAVFFHSLMFLLLYYMVAFFLLSKKSGIEKKWLYVTLISSTLFFLLKKYVLIHSYEQGAMENTNNITELFPHYWNLYSNKRFLLNCISKYYFLPLGLGAVMLVYLVKKEWKKLFFVFFSFTVYLLLINVCYKSESVQNYYIENLYLPLGVIVGLPLVYDVFPLLEKRKIIAYCSLALIIVVGVVRIGYASKIFTKRLNWERQYLSEHGNEKLMVHESHVPLDVLLMTWGGAYEFWLLSTVETGKTASIGFYDNLQSVEWGIYDKRNFVTKWTVHPYDQLPKKYFIMTDTSTAYRVIPR